jgi:Sec-independent protein translocase protein TatA
VLFGAKKLRDIGDGIGSAIKNLRHAVREGSDEAKAAEDNAAVQKSEGHVIEAEVIKEKDKVS